MDTVHLDLPYLFEATYVAPGKRNPDTSWARGTAPFAVPSGTADEFAASCSLDREGMAPLVTYVHEGRAYRAADPENVREADDHTAESLSLPLPSADDAAARIVPYRHWGAGTVESLHRDAVRYSRSRGPRAHVRGTSDRSEARRGEAARAYSEFLLVVDGEVLTSDPGHEPCLVVSVEGDRVVVEPCVAPSYDFGAEHFRADRGDDAMAYARVMAAATGGTAEWRADALRVLDPALLRFDEAVAVARCLANAWVVGIEQFETGLGLNVSRFPDVTGIRPGLSPEALADSRRMLAVASGEGTSRDAGWAAEVLALYGRLLVAEGCSKTAFRALDAALAPGRQAWARWEADLRPRYPALAGGRLPDVEPEDEDAVAAMSM